MPGWFTLKLTDASCCTQLPFSSGTESAAATDATAEIVSSSARAVIVYADDIMSNRAVNIYFI
jgi:hypothetical protein